MSTDAKNLLENDLALPASERASIAEGLLASLDRPDPEIDALWAKEAEDRLGAFEKGEITAVTAEEVFSEFADSIQV
jgi:putative addiction module component (TIGR02574 family)